MYSLLAIDDEKLAVEGLLSVVDWNKMSISPVFTANSIDQAKEVFETHDIDIMICDIEMPQGSGLELLEWVKKRYLNTEALFLTCHADFEYAKQAIQLGCVDYILKPPKAKELESVIQKVICQMENRKKLIEFSRYGEFWSKHQPLLIERFILDIISRDIPPVSEAVAKEASERNIPFDENIKVLPVLIGVQRWYKELGQTEERKNSYEIKKSIVDNILIRGLEGQTLELGTGKYLCMIYIDQLSDYVERLINSGCNKLIEICNESYFCDLSCYIGEPVYIFKLAEIVDKLIDIENNNIMFDNKVMMLHQRIPRVSNVKVPDMSQWSSMLMEGDKDAVLSGINDYFKKLIDFNEADANFLKQFNHDFIQMIYYVLKQKNIQAHMLLGDSYSEKLFESASKSVTDTLIWIRHIIIRSIEFMGSVEKTETVVEKVKYFVRSNLEKDINRETVANYVYLSPNYVTQIFKEETGKTIMEYLFSERLRIAIQLLCNSTLPVSTIATKIGYTNFSHFSQIFKKYTGLTPNEYRKNHLSDKKE